MSRNCDNSNFIIVFAHRKYSCLRMKQYTTWNDKSQVTLRTMEDNKTMITQASRKRKEKLMKYIKNIDR